MSPPTPTIVTTLGQGSSVIREHLSNVKMVILWAEGYNLRWSYPFDVKFSFILIGLPDGSTFLFDLMICHDLVNVLRPILECPTIIKVICNQLELRRVLWNELKINLTSFFDIQLALASNVNQNSSFKAICTGFGLKNGFVDENSANNKRFWLERPLTPQMLDICRENALLLHQIYQNLSFGANEMTHDLRICQNLPQNVQEPPKNKNPVRMMANEAVLISWEFQAKAVVSELYESTHLNYIGVKWSQGQVLGRSVDLLTIGLAKKTYIFDMSSFIMAESEVISGLKSILELPCLKKIVFGIKTGMDIKEKYGIQLVDVYDLKREPLEIIPKQDCMNRTLFALSKYINPDLSFEIKDQMGSDDILVSIGAAMKLYFYLFESLRRLYKDEVKIPAPKGFKMAKAPLLPLLPPKSAEIQKRETPGTSSSNSPSHNALKSGIPAPKPATFTPKLLPTTMISKYEDFVYANEYIRNFKIISLDCKSSNGIALIVIGTPSKIFIFDVNGKPEKSMPILKGIIENNGIKKIMYNVGDILQELRNQFDILPRNKIDVFSSGDSGAPEAFKVLASLKKMQNQFESSNFGLWKSRPVKGVLPKASTPTPQCPPNGVPMGNDIGTELMHLREMIEALRGDHVKANLLKSVDHITELVQKGSQSGSTGKNKTVKDSKSVQTIFTGTIYGSDITTIFRCEPKNKMSQFELPTLGDSDGKDSDLGKKHPLLMEPVLGTIFPYLSFKDLKSCHLVCKSWNVNSIRFLGQKSLKPVNFSNLKFREFAYLKKEFENSEQPCAKVKLFQGLQVNWNQVFKMAWHNFLIPFNLSQLIISGNDRVRGDFVRFFRPLTFALNSLTDLSLKIKWEPICANSFDLLEGVSNLRMTLKKLRFEIYNPDTGTWNSIQMISIEQGKALYRTLGDLLQSQSPFLEELYLEFDFKIANAEELEYIKLPVFPHLVLLTLNLGVEMSTGIQDVFQPFDFNEKFPQLAHLNISSIFLYATASIAFTEGHPLKRLEVSRSEGFGLADFDDETEGHFDLLHKSFPHIEEFSSNDWTKGSEFYWVDTLKILKTAVFFIEFNYMHLKKLEYIDISLYTEVDEDDPELNLIEHLMEHFLQLPKLKSFRITLDEKSIEEKTQIRDQIQEAIPTEFQAILTIV